MQVAPKKRWYLVQCKPRQDFRALKHLEIQGYTCLLPMLLVEHLKNGKLTHKEEPYFPGYLFIELDTFQDNWMPIRSTRGVSQVVRFGGSPLPVPDSAIRTIRSQSTAIVPLFKLGDRVRIDAQNGAGMEAIFQDKDGTKRVNLLLNLMQRDFIVSIPISQVTPVAH